MGDPQSNVEVLPVEPGAPRRARETARRWLAETGSSERADDLLLLVSELVANAVSSASGGTIRLTLSAAGEALRCEVANRGDGWPVHRVVPATAPSGRGLHLVDLLASRWGAAGENGSTVVWFELDR